MLLLLTAGLFSGCLGPPDTFSDMRSRLLEVSAPADFLLIAEDQNGLRSGFAAAPGPTVTRSFSAPWQSGALCARIESILHLYGEPELSGSGNCGYQTSISTGLRAKIVNVWRYRLEIYANAPMSLPNPSEKSECARQREEQTPLYARWEPCWVRAGDALVRVIVHGKIGL